MSVASTQDTSIHYRRLLRYGFSPSCAQAIAQSATALSELGDALVANMKIKGSP